MSKEYYFNVEIAEKYGVNEAIVLKNLMFWIDKNIANNKHYYNGFYWTYNSIRAFSLLFPFWTEKQIRGILNRLIEKEAIKKGNFNKKGYDRTLWYTIIDESLKGKSILPKGQMDITNKSNAIDPEGKPIPYINANSKPNNKNIYISADIPLHEKICLAYNKIHFDKILQTPPIKEKHYLAAKAILDSSDNPVKLSKSIIEIISAFFTELYWFNTKQNKCKVIDMTKINLSVFLAHCLEILADQKVKIQTKVDYTGFGEKK